MEDGIRFQVGKPFPMQISQREGIHLELWQDGLILAVQFPGLTWREQQAFETSFCRYSYWESQTDVPIAVWVFDFPHPFGQIDCTFNARIVQQRKLGYVENFLALEEGQRKNAMTIFLLDGQMLVRMKLVGLQQEAVRMFHQTIQTQIEISYTQAAFDRSLRQVYQYSTERLFEMGKMFTM